MIKIITAMIAMTINTPTPIPALKIPPTTEQLETVVSMKNNNAVNRIDFFMIVLINFLKY